MSTIIKVILFLLLIQGVVYAQSSVTSNPWLQNGKALSYTVTGGSVKIGTLLNGVEYSNGTCTTAATISPANGNDQSITLTNGDACALTFTQPSSATTPIRLKIIQSSSSSYNGTISGCKWPGGTVMTPTATTGAVDWMSVEFDGTNAYCAPVGQAFS